MSNISNISNISKPTITVTMTEKWVWDCPKYYENNIPYNGEAETIAIWSV